MEIKRKTEIFVETNRRFVIHQPDTVERVVCPQCGEWMLAAEQAALVLGITRRRVYQFIEKGSAHFAETEAGILFVCPNSLANVVAPPTRNLLGE